MLRYITGFKLSEPWIGLLGLLSSAMTIYDIWPEAPLLAASSLAPPDSAPKIDGMMLEANDADEGVCKADDED